MDYEAYTEWFLSTFEAEEILEMLDITAIDLVSEFDFRLQKLWEESCE